jgi:hypothetical protein
MTRSLLSRAMIHLTRCVSSEPSLYVFENVYDLGTGVNRIRLEVHTGGTFDPKSMSTMGDMASRAGLAWHCHASICAIRRKRG